MAYGRVMKLFILTTHAMTSPLMLRHLGLNVPWGSLHLRQTPSFSGFLDMFWQLSRFQKLLCL